MSVVLALDAGTTGVRTFAVGDDGAPRGFAYRELTQHYPRPGWVEHDASEIWDVMSATIGEVVASLDGEPVAAIGITNQRETTVVWDRRTGEPRHRAIVWQDRRTADRCRILTDAGHLDTVRTTTGLVLDPYFSGTKLAWLITDGGVDVDADLAFGTVDSWLLWKLTGGAVHATEPSNASRTLLFDIGTLSWSDEMCDLLGVPTSCLPELLPSSGALGVTSGVDALPDGTPVTGIAGDQQAALFGQACVKPGMTKNTYGTGSFVLMNIGSERPDPVEGLLTTVGWSLGDVTADATSYALEGAIFATGAAVGWLRDGLGIIADAAEVEPLAASIDSTEGVHLVPAFTGLGSPWWDPYARGTVVGITRGTSRAHLARAVVESMAFQTRDVVDAMSSAWGHPVSALRADGGASVMDLLLQLQADQLGVTVARPDVAETTALGAAYLAGLAAGVWASIEEVAAMWTLDREFTPQVPAATADAAHGQWLRAVERSRAWAGT
ncbi:MAG TPA: glycerol kinase GlpK [Acidimicrobiales bacterium]